jgi:hypothetical protein
LPSSFSVTPSMVSEMRVASKPRIISVPPLPP